LSYIFAKDSSIKTSKHWW